MSNRLHIDPSEIKITDIREIRRRLWDAGPTAAERAAQKERERIADLLAKYRAVEVLGESVSALLRRIAAEHELAVSDLIGNSRMTAVVIARQHAMYELRVAFPNMGLARIGKILGGKDHTTVLSAIRRHVDRHDLPMPESTYQVAKRKTSARTASCPVSA